MATARLSHDDYTVAWICALSHEMAAGKLMFDQIHAQLTQPLTDINSYILGVICGHNVVMLCLPAGSIGTNAAAAAVAHMQGTFPRIQHGLMVGVGGGVPSKKDDIRLGDIVISTPGDKHPGVVQYDFGKAMTSGHFEQTGTLNRPPGNLLATVSKLQVELAGIDRPISTLVREKLAANPGMSKFGFPGQDRDQLFDSSYDHPEFEDDCSECDPTKLIIRDSRPTEEPQLFYGLIASGNQVMKDGRTRDTLCQKFPVFCFEMEAAGIMNHLPCLVVRGICDYSDSHKNKKWQGYAALTAAAYARLLLSTVSLTPRHKDSTTEGSTFNWSHEQKECLRDLFLVDSPDIMNSLKRRKGGYVSGTCKWILETSQLNQWLVGTSETVTAKSNILWLYGNPGIGKSTMAIAMTEALPLSPLFESKEKELVYFFCESSSSNQNTAVAILRGVLYQLIQQNPSLIEQVMEKYQVQGKNLFTSFDAMWRILLAAGRNHGKIYCIIDALDECEPESQEILLAQLGETFGENSGPRGEHGIHFLITSRPYDEIRRHLGNFDHCNLSTFKMLRNDVTTLIRKRVDELAKRNDYPPTIKNRVYEILQEKADGTFLWVGIACGELRDIRSRDAVRTLEKLPKSLDALYRDLLRKAREANLEEYRTIIQILGFVAVALRPLTVSNLVDACQLYTENDLQERLAFMREDISMCRLLVVVQDGTVSLLHKSLKDFLFQGDDPIVDEKQAHASLAYSCLDSIISAFQSNGIFPYLGRPALFLYYATEHWPHHAHLSGSNFSVLERHHIMFSADSHILNAWRTFLNYASGRFHYFATSHSVLEVAARWGIQPLAIYEASRHRLSKSDKWWRQWQKINAMGQES